ncbi:MAG: DinB family protein [Candidatus Limnocylindrales bacterium]
MDDLIAWVREVLVTTPERWERLAESVDVALLQRRPAPGEWSALECLQHLLDTETGAFAVRVEAILAGRDFAAFDPDAAGSKPEPSADPAALARRFEAARVRSLVAFDSVTPADLERTARHPELGVVTMREMLNEWAAHDLMHTVQAERALMQPFIAGSGKWRHYFADHDVEQVVS